jgi:hypothetical protein
MSRRLLPNWRKESDTNREMKPTTNNLVNRYEGLDFGSMDAPEVETLPTI